MTKYFDLRACIIHSSTVFAGADGLSANGKSWSSMCLSYLDWCGVLEPGQIEGFAARMANATEVDWWRCEVDVLIAALEVGQRTAKCQSVLDALRGRLDLAGLNAVEWSAIADAAAGDGGMAGSAALVVWHRAEHGNPSNRRSVALLRVVVLSCDGDRDKAVHVARALRGAAV